MIVTPYGESTNTIDKDGILCVRLPKNTHKADFNIFAGFGKIVAIPV